MEALRPIGGPVASAGDLVLAPVRQASVRRLPPWLACRFGCEMSPLGDSGIVIGAALLAAEATR